MKSALIKYAIGVIAAIAIIAALYAWFKPDVTPPVSVHEIAKVDPAVKVLTKKAKNIQYITVYDKKQASKALGLPESVSNDDTKQVLASAEIKPYGGSQTVTAVLDESTGNTGILVKRNPLPFFEFRNDKEIGVRVGTSTDGVVADLYGRWTFARIGSVHLAGYGEVSGNEMNTRAKAMLEASYRW